jgi:hypothetical protein
MMNHHPKGDVRTNEYIMLVHQSHMYSVHHHHHHHHHEL